MGNTKTVNILFIEDDPSYADLVRRIFQEDKSCCNLTVVGGIQEAKSHLDHMHPDLIIADLRLPDGKGTELLYDKRVKGQIPVVIITGLGSEEDAVEAMKAGALDYVIKTQENSMYLPHLARRTLREWDNRTRHRLTKAMLEKTNDQLEYKVRLHTAKLENENIKLRGEIEELKQTVKELKRKTAIK
ncbi:response regulator [bacterium]|nr:response regulator [bacterium]